MAFQGRLLTQKCSTALDSYRILGKSSGRVLCFVPGKLSSGSSTSSCLLRVIWLLSPWLWIWIPSWWSAMVVCIIIVAIVISICRKLRMWSRCILLFNCSQHMKPLSSRTLYHFSGIFFHQTNFLCFFHPQQQSTIRLLPCHVLTQWHSTGTLHFYSPATLHHLNYFTALFTHLIV